MDIKKRNCVIIHGCPSNAERAKNPETRTYDKHWIPWLKKELDAAGMKTDTPLMPTPWEPEYEKFKKEFDRCEVNEDTILVGHSCGAAFFVRWLGETKRKVLKLILVAPWKIPEEEDGKESLKIFHRALGGEVVELQGHGHYTFGDMGTEEFPELLGTIMR